MLFKKKNEPCTFCTVTRYALVFALGLITGIVYSIISSGQIIL